jgi:hypothetical protein
VVSTIRDSSPAHVVSTDTTGNALSPCGARSSDHECIPVARTRSDPAVTIDYVGGVWRQPGEDTGMAADSSLLM